MLNIMLKLFQLAIFVFSASFLSKGLGQVNAGVNTDWGRGEVTAERVLTFRRNKLPLNCNRTCPSALLIII